MVRKYHAAIVAIAKDENPYFLEWAAYHLALGFEHIWVYDNMSRKGLADMLSIPSAHPYVTVIPWPSLPGRNAQAEVYDHYRWTYGTGVQWTAVIDLDELICLKRHADIAAFLDAFPDAAGVAINWRFFGSAGQAAYRPGLLMERFTRASEIAFSPNRGVKAIYRTDKVARLLNHMSVYLEDARVRSSDGTEVENTPWVPIRPSNFEVAQVNHYFVKSKEEWQSKLQRGYGWAADDRTDSFEEYDRNECEDTTVLKWKDETERWIRIISQPAGASLRARASNLRLSDLRRWLRRRMR